MENVSSPRNHLLLLFRSENVTSALEFSELGRSPNEKKLKITIFVQMSYKRNRR